MFENTGESYPQDKPTRGSTRRNILAGLLGGTLLRPLAKGVAISEAFHNVLDTAPQIPAVLREAAILLKLKELGFEKIPLLFEGQVELAQAPRRTSDIKKLDSVGKVQKIAEVATTLDFGLSHLRLNERGDRILRLPKESKLDDIRVVTYGGGRATVFYGVSEGDGGVFELRTRADQGSQPHSLVSVVFVPRDLYKFRTPSILEH